VDTPVGAQRKHNPDASTTTPAIMVEASALVESNNITKRASAPKRTPVEAIFACCGKALPGSTITTSIPETPATILSFDPARTVNAVMRATKPMPIFDAVLKAS
jgi:hypothetical protein